MPLHGWMLALCLWHSALGPLGAAAPAGAVAAQTPPPLRPVTEPSGGGGATPAKGRRAGSAWPFWAATEDKTPSFLSLPFSLPFDLWRSGARSPENVGGTEGSSGTSPSQSGLADIKGPPSAPTTGLSRGEPFAPTRTGMVAPLTTSDPPTPTATADGKAARIRHPPWVVVSAGGKDTLSPTPTRQAGTAALITATHSGPTSTLAPSTVYGGRGEPMRWGDRSSTSTALVTATPRPTPALERTKAAGPQLEIDAGLSESGARAAGERAEVEGAVGDAGGDAGGDFETVAWRPIRTEPPVSAKPPAGKRCRLPPSCHCTS